MVAGSAVLGEMQEASVTMDVISFSAAICACDKSSMWEQAQALHGKMREASARFSYD